MRECACLFACVCLLVCVCMGVFVCVRVLAGCKIKKSKGVIKFKLRCSRFLYTHRIINSPQIAERLKASLPRSLKTEELEV